MSSGLALDVCVFPFSNMDLHRLSGGRNTAWMKIILFGCLLASGIPPPRAPRKEMTTTTTETS